jgi:hypothetical protein
MAMSFAGWRRVAIERGVMLMPSEPDIGVIQLRHRQPLRPLRSLLSHLTGVPVGGSPMRLSAPPRAITTDEGEYGALIRLEGGAARRTVGVVFGDEWLATVDARVAALDRFAMFDEAAERLTMSLGLGLGADRWRRPWYRPPAGWSCVQRVRCDLWLVPGFPRVHGAISVFHARPEQETDVLVQHHKLFEALTREYVARRSEPRPVQTRSGRAGKTLDYDVRFGGLVREAADVVLADGRFLYLARLETDLEHRDRHTAAFLELVDTIEPIPRARQDLSGLVHWFD